MTQTARSSRNDNLVSSGTQEDGNTLATTFEIASASTQGALHAATRKNNQDALAFRVAGNAIILAAADGCSGGSVSEFGARLGAQSLASAIARAGSIDLGRETDRAALKGEVLADLCYALRLFGGDARAAINEHFLFTLVGCVLTPERATLFCWGDGTFVVNGERVVLPTMGDNKPAYCGYALIPGCTVPAEHLQFRVIREIPTSEIQSLIVGTDGVAQLFDIAERTFPGREEVVGDVAQLWENDLFFANPFALTRLLTRMNPMPPPWRTGLLADDTSLFVVRRKKEQGT